MDILCYLNLNKGGLIISVLWLCIDKLLAPRLVRTKSVFRQKHFANLKENAFLTPISILSTYCFLFKRELIENHF